MMLLSASFWEPQVGVNRGSPASRTVGRHDPPFHGVDARIKRRQRNPHHRAVALVDVRIGLVDLLPALLRMKRLS